MNTRAEIQHALERLPVGERAAIARWLQEFAEGQYSGCRVEEPRAAYAAPAPDYMTLEEFLDSEDEGLEKYEYVNGVMRAMASATLAHCRITQNLFVALRSRLNGGPCEAFGAGLQLNLQTAKNKIVYLPDVMVACERKGWGRNWLHNPKLVVEVLSPSTQQIDRREKAVNYREVASLDEYVIASQEQYQLIFYRRADDWAPTQVSGFDATAEFRSLGLSVELAEIYEGVRERRPASIVFDEDDQDDEDDQGEDDE